jgi:ribosomal protein S18 acetylase RimI-like enzyme
MVAGALQIREMRANDLECLMALHGETFAGTLGASVGKRYIRAFFRWFLLNPECVKLACMRDSEMVGYVFGGADGYGAKMNRSIFWPAVLGILTHPWIIVSPAFRRTVTARFRALTRWRGLRTVRMLGDTTDQLASDGSRYVLVGIGVSPHVRRQGVAILLMDSFESQIWEREYESIRLTVYRWNKAAMRLYENRGWRSPAPPTGAATLRYVLDRSSRFTSKKTVSCG